MGAFQKLMLRITPILMLICFICLGITHTFRTTGVNTDNLTYLTSTREKVIDNEGNTNDVYITYYEFDTKSYVENINVGILKNSLTKVVDIDGYRNNLNQFKTIWNNGYQVGDIFKTMVNAILLVVNSLITPINIVLLPIRITSGILLTGFSLVGINTNRQTGLIGFFKKILNNGYIPLLTRTNNVEQYQDANERLEGIWEFEASLFESTPYYLEADFVFRTYFEEKRYYSMTINNGTITYIDTEGNKITVYENGQWINPELKQNVIEVGQQANGQKAQEIIDFLSTCFVKWDE